MTLPIARLHHIQPGQTIRLAGDTKPRTLIAKIDHYGYFDMLQVSLCHPVAEEYMEFGSDGWRIKLIHTIGG